MNNPLAELAAALSPYGLIVRGAFRPTADDLAETDLEIAAAARLVMIGNAGSAMWGAFEPFIDGDPDPLDRWIRRVVDPVAKQLGARPIYPFDEPSPPVQRWAMRAERLKPSPLGILIHPRYGLWHAYRAVLVFAHDIDSTLEGFEPPDEPAQLCESCAEKPCLTACPVGAFSPGDYDVLACAGYLAGSDGRSCLHGGCQARNACPVGSDWRYSDAQITFHMTAFARAVTAHEPPG